MSVNDMKIVKTEYGFDTYYIRGRICKVIANCPNGILEFFYKDGHVDCVDISSIVEISTSYNAQFGISVTNDGDKFFIQSWKSGLYCFATMTGELVWHLKKRNAYEILLNGSKLVCRFYNSQVCNIDILTGAVESSFSLSHNSIFVPLSNEYVLVGPKKGKYEVLNLVVSSVATIPEKMLNPHAFENFIVQSASLINGGILVAGIEYSNEMMTLARENKTIDLCLANCHFLRQVSVPSLDNMVSNKP